MIKIGIVGHRFLRNSYTIDFVTKQCNSILRNIQGYYNNVIALSAVAEGADMIFAEAAFELNIPFEIVRPFEQYVEDFTSPGLKDRYYRLLNGTSREIKLPYLVRSDEAYYNAMQWVVDSSNVVVAVWDGKKGNGIAGTAECVKQVKGRGRDWIHIDVSNLSTTYYLNDIIL